jgi:hypothetical protein
MLSLHMAAIGSIVIPTSGRVESLERTLMSYVKLAKEFGRDPDFVIADDSCSAQYRQHTRGILRSIARSHHVRIFYAGLEEKRAFAAALVGAAAVPASIVEFALLGTAGMAPRSGANRNVLLLDSVDQLFFSADDDTVCRGFNPVGHEPGTLEVHSVAPRVWDGHGAPSDFIWRFFPDLDAAASAAEPDGSDILALHEQLLGERILDIEGGFAKRLLRSEQPNHEPAGKAGRVMFTMAGLLGDVGVDERWHLLATTPEVLAQQRSESAYGLARDSRIVLRCARRTTLTRWVGLHGMFFGADHRRILPPFFPMFRGQDTLMGWMARRCYPHDQFGFLPCALMHVPPPRTFTRGFEFLLCGLSMASILVQLVDQPTQSESAENALQTMSRELQSAGEAPSEEFAEVLRSRWRAADDPWLEGFISSIRSPALAHLRHGLERVVETRYRVRREHDGSLPFDVLEGRAPNEARAFTQELVRLFGELVGVWPAIVDGTRRLRAQGTRPAVALA